jgi:hypothetical protein
MPEPTIINAEDVEEEITLEDKIEALEGLVRQLLEGHKNTLEHFREMIAAVTEISGESSEE